MFENFILRLCISGAIKMQFMTLKPTNFLPKWTFSIHLSHLMTKSTKWLCAHRRLRSAWESAQSDQSSLSAWRNIGSSATHWVDSEDSWLDLAHAQADLSLRWAHSHCWFCHVTAHLSPIYHNALLHIFTFETALFCTTRKRCKQCKMRRRPMKNNVR